MSTFANRTKKGTVALGVISALLISSCSGSTDSASTTVLDVPMDADIAEVNVGTEQGADTSTEIVTDNNDTIDFANVAGGEAEAVAINQPTTVEETIPETEIDDLIPNTDAILNVGNALDIWRETVSVINEDQVNQFLQLMATDFNLPNAGLFLENSVDVIEFSESIVLDSPYQYESAFLSNEFISKSIAEGAEGDSYTCVSSGGIQMFTWPGGRDTVFNNCAVAEITYSGTVGKRNVYRGSISTSPFFDVTRVASDGMTTTLSGNNFFGNSSYVTIDSRVGWNDLNFRQFGAEAEFRLVDFNMRRTAVDSETNSPDGGMYVDTTFVSFNRYQLEDTIEGRFDVFAPWTGTEMGLSVSINLSYFDDVLVGLEDPDIEFPSRDPVEPFNWQAGNVTISASDGSSIVITPSEIELGSFELELSNGEVIGPLPWLDEYFIDRQ